VADQAGHEVERGVERLEVHGVGAAGQPGVEDPVPHLGEDGGVGVAAADGGSRPSLRRVLPPRGHPRPGAPGHPWPVRRS